MDEWERVINQEIAPGDRIELPNGAVGDVVSVVAGPGGDIEVEVNLRYPVTGESDPNAVSGTYVLPAAGNSRRYRP
jgi:hypothetical protein